MALNPIQKEKIGYILYILSYTLLIIGEIGAIITFFSSVERPALMNDFLAFLVIGIVGGLLLMVAKYFLCSSLKERTFEDKSVFATLDKFRTCIKKIILTFRLKGKPVEQRTYNDIDYMPWIGESIKLREHPRTHVTIKGMKIKKIENKVALIDVFVESPYQTAV